MRLAIVAASSYEENGQVTPIPNAEIDVQLFGERLAEADAGFAVHVFQAQRGLAEGIEEIVAALPERPEALIFYFWGYALLSEERGATLLLDGPKLSSFTLARLRRLLSELAQVSLVILDTTLAEGSVGAPIDAVRAMGAALSSGDSNVSSLIAARVPGQRVTQGPPPFTGLLQMILDEQTGNAQALTPEALFRAMQAEEVMFADIPAAGCFLGQRGFDLVAGEAASGSAPVPRAYEDTDEVTAPHASKKRGPKPPPPPPPPLARPPIRSAVLSIVDIDIDIDIVSEPDAAPAPDSGATGGSVSLPSSAPPASSAALYCRQLLAEFERVADRDGAYRAAMCLEALGEADINESLLASTHRPEGLQAVRGVLSYADWQQRLCAGCDEPQTVALLGSLGSALCRVGFQHARRMRREVVLPEEARQDPEKSTTTLAKTLHWAARLLCVSASELYVLPEVPGTISFVPGPEQPKLSCARSLGSGFSLPELVCLWARELSFARVEQAALCYFPDATELSQLLLAACAVGGATNLRAIGTEAKRLASGLKREVRGAALEALSAAAGAFPVHAAEAHAEAFIRSAEFVARRVALVACGDLELTLKLDRRFPRGGLSTAEERRADLMRFTISSEFGHIRHALGIART
ncbi:MAG: hypothetical protein ABJB12_10930 [Pseudomonadota bacterium]